MFLLIFFFVTFAEAGYLSRQPLDQATTLMNLRHSSHLRPVPDPVLAQDYDELIKHHELSSSRIDRAIEKQDDSHLLKDMLPGQPAGVNFKQYAGSIIIDKSRGRVLFYYFVESALNSSMKPLMLFLNGGS